ncbi:MAG: hypothetical protein GWP61_11890 [Chloroflexi bacterium]|nr:hypothetical protein [Chloroflexota bacterium]
MSTVKVIVMGTLIGVTISVLTILVVLAGLMFLTQKATPIIIVALLAILNGAFLGTTSASLGYLTTGRERYVLVLLIELAIAALAVLIGRYGNGSLIPVGIYALAILNSLLISRATAKLKLRSNKTTSPYLQG